MPQQLQRNPRQGCLQGFLLAALGRQHRQPRVLNHGFEFIRLAEFASSIAENICQPGALLINAQKLFLSHGAQCENQKGDAGVPYQAAPAHNALPAG